MRLADCVDDFATIESFFRDCGLTVLQNEYTDYWYDDTETDPANITNEDNQTGLAYLDANIQDMDLQPNKYRASGHVSLIHDMCQVVYGKINERTGKMTVTRLDKTNFSRTADGSSYDPADPSVTGNDVFLLVPHYWYKGVNDYKNARKHYFVSSLADRPTSSATTTQRHALSETGILQAEGKAVDNTLMEVGETFNTQYLATAATYSVYRVPVGGMKQVRFPAVNHSRYCCAFVNDDGKILSMPNLNMTGTTSNPADFMEEEGDYDFRSIPDGAEWLYFTCHNSAPKSLEAIVVDTDELEAIEPDWVEHLPELVGIYQGYVPGITTGGNPSNTAIGLRSVTASAQVSKGLGTGGTSTVWIYDDDGNTPNSDETGNPANVLPSRLAGTSQDFFNLTRFRGDGYSTTPYETSKDMANLFMAWVGTRDVEGVIGNGRNALYNPGSNNSVAFGDSRYASNYNLPNKIWGLEGWTGCVIEALDKCCLNAPSFAEFKRSYRESNAMWDADNRYCIVQQDGVERKIKASPSNGEYNVARVRFGRYCDIIVSSYAGTDTTCATCYSATQQAVDTKGRVVRRSGSSANVSSGVAYLSQTASSFAGSVAGARLCYFGEIIVNE